MRQQHVENTINDNIVLSDFTMHSKCKPYAGVLLVSRSSCVQATTCLQNKNTRKFNFNWNLRMATSRMANSGNLCAKEKHHQNNSSDDRILNENELHSEKRARYYSEKSHILMDF